MTTEKTEMKTETVCFGDCLEHLKRWIRWNNDIFEGQPSLADLIYLDPPWNSKANYNVLFGSGKSTDDDSASAQETAFTDMWQYGPEVDVRVKKICGIIDDSEYYDHPAQKSMLGLQMFIPKTGMLAYCAYMAERLALLRMLLKETGSIYLHCDSYASHYLKMVMDDIFGQENFRNEIIWQRSYVKGTRGPRRSLGKITDSILLYAKSKKTQIVIPKTIPKELPKFKHEDERGHYRAVTQLMADSKLHESPRYEWNGLNPKYGWRVSRENLERLHKEGLIHFSSSGRLYRKQYAVEYEGMDVGNLWNDIPPASPEERTGYATQKPLALLNRIIEASTNEGDVVLDPFCGCGTAVVAASMLKRKFVGIDISLFTVETVTANRLNKEAGIAEEDIKILGIPADVASARRFAKDDPFAFERFAVEACKPGMVANKLQRSDKGIDGRGKLLHPVKENGKKKSMILAQVKAGKPTLSQVRDFANVIQTTEGAVAGVFITVEKKHWTDGMREVAAQLGTFQHEHSMEEFPRLQHWHIGQWFLKTPHLRLPRLPELADPLSGKEMTALKQTGFLTKQYG